MTNFQPGQSIPVNWKLIQDNPVIWARGLSRGYAKREGTKFVKELDPLETAIQQAIRELK